MRYLGLDLGTKTLGISLSDSTLTIASTLKTIKFNENDYDSLIDDDFFIGLTNGMAKFIDGIGSVVDSLGGMKGIITLIGSIFLTHFSKEIPGALQKLGENFSVFTGKAQKDAIKMMEQNQSALNHFTSDNMTNSLDAELAGLTKLNEMKTVLAKTSHTLTEAERQQFEQEIQMVEAASRMVQQEAEKVDAIEAIILEEVEGIGGKKLKQIVKSYEENINSTDGHCTCSLYEQAGLRPCFSGRRNC